LADSHRRFLRDVRQDPQMGRFGWPAESEGQPTRLWRRISFAGNGLLHCLVDGASETVCLARRLLKVETACRSGPWGPNPLSNQAVRAMPYGMYLSADGAIAQQTRLETIANNMANVDTVGFKRELAVFQARAAESIRLGREMPGAGGIDDIGGGTMIRQTKTDYTTGPMKRTGTPSDVAITGDGFFLVEKGDKQYLTRAGDFTFNDRGELLTPQGYKVLNDSGSPIVINPTLRYEITSSGAIRQQGTSQNLALVRPNSPGDLAKAGENLFRPLANVQPLAPNDRRVASGYLEGSGVKPTTEMVHLIEATRAIEANVNILQTQDQMLSGLVNRAMR
jgi:flagellar basal-body rod protein FlgF